MKRIVLKYYCEVGTVGAIGASLQTSERTVTGGLSFTSVTGLTTARICQPAPSTPAHNPCFILCDRELVQFFCGLSTRRSAHVLLVLTAGFISAGVRASAALID